ncbi:MULTISPECIES: hypothetical protein [unclassified Coleofasciculus]|uniref:hypothetical protein n=1 Tax=unclassified Coleofasciculus TaxID=2692782 RepID=UPI0018815FA5|nr:MULTISPECIES: hypothetical protein [unclassified Coleofasciculus]MBE9129112.1 hypothetical protein [Coleofasciculus sp. LEGE 07081]MBE9149843.1 hypothetical protein [Coleofasciculus sp. LEGE 07092]
MLKTRKNVFQDNNCRQSYHQLKVQPKPPWVSKIMPQKLHLALLGNLVFWVSLASSPATWSAQTEDAGDSVNLEDWQSPIETSIPRLEHSQALLTNTSHSLKVLEPEDSTLPSAAIAEAAANRDAQLKTLSLNCNNFDGVPTESGICSVASFQPLEREKAEEPVLDGSEWVNQGEYEVSEDQGNLPFSKIANFQTPTDQPTRRNPTSPNPPPDVAPTREPEPIPMETFPDLPNLEESDTEGDPELGILRLRELEPPVAPSEPTVYLLGRVGYLRSDNLFSGVDPVDDGLFRTGVTLLAAPSLGNRTSLLASVSGNIIRYSNAEAFNYDELRFDLGIRQQLSRRAYGEVGWFNRHLFTEEGGDRFLNDHTLYLELGRRDSLAQQFTLDTFYKLRVSFAEPDSRSQLINTVGASLAYNPTSSLRLAFDYQYALATFTEQDRQDEYHQLTASLAYRLSSNSQLYVFGGQSFGASSNSAVDFDGLVFGVGLNFNIPLF